MVGSYSDGPNNGHGSGTCDSAMIIAMVVMAAMGVPLMAFPMALAVALTVAFAFALAAHLHNVVRAGELRQARRW